ncbi:hypothetical protein OROGR_010285 [Orobanche gracilis]
MNQFYLKHTFNTTMALEQKPRPNHLATAIFLFLFVIHCASALNNPDVQPLLLLKSSADPSDAVLTSWNSSFDPCTGSWLGVSCLHNRVTRLVLEKLDLQGGFPRSITLLTNLRVLSLKENGLSGRVPDLSNLTSLRLLFISHNRFSGELPVSLSSLPKLYRFDLSYNNFSGSIPLSFNRLTHLLTLRLERNGFSGSISGLSLLSLQDFNVSGNKLSGEIPVSLSDFPASSFLNNLVLCGSPLEECKAGSSDPTRPEGAMASPISPKTTVASSPTEMPSALVKPATAHRSKIGLMAIIGIMFGDVVVLGDSHVEKIV